MGDEKVADIGKGLALVVEAGGLVNYHPWSLR